MKVILFTQGMKRHMAGLTELLKTESTESMIVADYAARYMTPMEIMIKQMEETKKGNEMFVVHTKDIPSVDNVVVVKTQPTNKRVPSTVMWTGSVSGMSIKTIINKLKEL